MTRNNDTDIVQNHLHDPDVHKIYVEASERRLLAHCRALYPQDETKDNYITLLKYEINRVFLGHKLLTQTLETIDTIASRDNDQWTLLGYYNESGVKEVDDSYDMNEIVNLISAAVLHHNAPDNEVVLSYWNTLIHLHHQITNYDLCNAGIRSELVFSIAPCFPDIKIIENLNAFLTDLVKKFLIEQIQQNPSPYFTFRIIKQWIAYLDPLESEEAMALMLLWFKNQQQKLSGHLIATLKSYNLAGENELAVANAFAETVPLVPEYHPHISIMREIKERLLYNTAAHPAALKEVNEIILSCKQLDDLEEKNLPHFWKCYEAYEEIISSIDLVSFGEQALVREYELGLDAIEDYFNVIQTSHSIPIFSENERLSDLIQKINLLKEAHHYYFARDFFNKYDQADDYEKTNLTNKISQSKNKFLMSSDEIDEFKNALLNDQTELTLYQINRVLIQAFTTQSGTWTKPFAELFEAIIPFVNDNRYTPAKKLAIENQPAPFSNALKKQLRLLLYANHILDTPDSELDAVGFGKLLYCIRHTASYFHSFTPMIHEISTSRILEKLCEFCMSSTDSHTLSTYLDLKNADNGETNFFLLFRLLFVSLNEKSELLALKILINLFQFSSTLNIVSYAKLLQATASETSLSSGSNIFKMLLNCIDQASQLAMHEINILLSQHVNKIVQHINTEALYCLLAMSPTHPENGEQGLNNLWKLLSVLLETIKNKNNEVIKNLHKTLEKIVERLDANQILMLFKKAQDNDSPELPSINALQIFLYLCFSPEDDRLFDKMKITLIAVIKKCAHLPDFFSELSKALLVFNRKLIEKNSFVTLLLNNITTAAQLRLFLDWDFLNSDDRAQMWPTFKIKLLAVIQSKPDEATTVLSSENIPDEAREGLQISLDLRLAEYAPPPLTPGLLSWMGNATATSPTTPPRNAPSTKYH